MSRKPKKAKRERKEPKLRKAKPKKATLLVQVLIVLKAAEVRVDYLIVGLGNPGPKYANTRHNVGYLVVDELAARHSKAQVQKPQKFRRGGRKNPSGLSLTGGRILKGQVEVVEVEIASCDVVLAKPHTFMNLSGKALHLLRRKYQLPDIGRLIVVHDEMDFAPGRIQIKQGGSPAGHKGLASIRDSLGTLDFARLRVGIGKPPTKEAGANYVLSSIREPETQQAISEAVDLLEDFIAE